MTKRPLAAKPQRFIKAVTRAFKVGSSSGLNLLNNGAMKLGYTSIRSRLKPIHAPQAQSHHKVPAAPMIQRMSAAIGRPISAPSKVDFQHVGEPQLERHLVEAEAFFEAEGLPEREGQFEQAADQCECGEQRELLPHTAAHPGQQQFIEEVEAAKQRPTQQQCRAPGHLDESEACLGDGVVGGLLVRSERDGLRKGSGHRTAVLGDMTDLARGEPELHDEACDQCGREG